MPTKDLLFKSVVCESSDIGIIRDLFENSGFQAPPQNFESESQSKPQQDPWEIHISQGCESLRNVKV